MAAQWKLGFIRMISTRVANRGGELPKEVLIMGNRWSARNCRRPGRAGAVST
jgi:hypothetical protein